MSQPRFLADEDLRHSIIQGVRRAEARVTIKSVVDLGWSGALDEEVLEIACDQGWLIVSHDVNTMKARVERWIEAGRSIHGLFLVPQRAATRSVVESLTLIWSASEFEEWHNRIVYLPL